jgi:hypothetical protein
VNAADRARLEQDPSLFEGSNPFAGEPGASRALSWERAQCKVRIRELEESHRAELATVRSERAAMCAELELALQVCGLLPALDPSPEARRRPWSTLLAMVGFAAGRASVPPPVVQLATPAAKRKASK